jgi:hypothetical protein
MGAVADAFTAAFQDYITDGMPSSGARKPVKSEIRALGATIEALIASTAASKVADAINNGTTDVAPSQNAVFDALALKFSIAQAKQQPVISPMIWSAVLDNATSDAAAFTALAAEVSGKVFDLGGRTAYLGAAGTPPTNNNFVNGGFRNDTTKWSLPGQAFAQPFGQQQMAIKASDGVHMWPAGIGEPTNDNVLFLSWSESAEHTITEDAMLMLGMSYDGGESIIEEMTLWSEDDREPRFFVGGMVTGTRFGVLFNSVSTAGGGTVHGTYFAYVDHTPEQLPVPVVVDLSSTISNLHGNFIHSSTGNLVAFGHGGDDIKKFVSTNDGAAASWTAGVAFTKSVASGVPYEPVAEKMDTGKYVLLFRTAGNAFITHSTTGETWANPLLDTGIPLLGNPTGSCVQGGNIYFFFSPRRSIAVQGFEDKLIYAKYNCAELWAAMVAGTMLPVPAMGVAVTGRTSAVGYMQRCQLRDGSWLALIADGEWPNGSDAPTSTRLITMGGQPRVQLSEGALESRRYKPPISGNCNFSDFSRKTTWGATTFAYVADGFSISSVGGNFEAERVVLDDDVRRAIKGAGAYGLRVWTSGQTSLSIRTTVYGRRAMQALSAQEIAAAIVADGAFPGPYKLRARATYGTGGSTADSSDTIEYVPKQNAMRGASTRFEGAFYTPDMAGKTWGVGPLLVLDLLTEGTSAIDVTFYTDVWDVGNKAQPWDQVWQDIMRPELDRRVHQMPFDAGDQIIRVLAVSTSAFEATLPYDTVMYRTPTVSIGNGVAASGFELEGIGDCTALAFDDFSPRACRIYGTVSGTPLTSGNWYILNSKNDGQYFLNDAGL